MGDHLLHRHVEGMGSTHSPMSPMEGTELQSSCVSSSMRNEIVRRFVLLTFDAHVDGSL